VDTSEEIDIESQKRNLNFPKLVELDWVVFDVKNQKVFADKSIVVDPGVPLQTSS